MVIFIECNLFSKIEIVFKLLIKMFLVSFIERLLGLIYLFLRVVWICLSNVKLVICLLDMLMVKWILRLVVLSFLMVL